jgi:hypothetical protein
MLVRLLTVDDKEAPAMAGVDRRAVEEVVGRVLVDERADVLRESLRWLVARLMEVEVVRHEALSDRAGCETPRVGCRSSPGEAEGSLDPEPRARVESSPDNDGSRRDYRTARAWQARQRGVAEANQWSNPLKTPRSSNPMDMGCRCGAREPVDFAGCWPSVAITSRRRGCATGAA